MTGLGLCGGGQPATRAGVGAVTGRWAGATGVFGFPPKYLAAAALTDQHSHNTKLPHDPIHGFKSAGRTIRKDVLRPGSLSTSMSTA